MTCLLQRILTLAALWMTASSVHAGTVMETLSRDLTSSAGKGVTTTTTYAQDGRMRVEPSPGESVMIFKDDVIYNVNRKDKSYVVMDRASMKRMAEQISPALKQMQEQLAKMPPEQRAQMEKMMGHRMAGVAADKPQEIRKTGRTGKAGGHACTYVEIHQGGAVTDELCVASPSALKGSQELMAAAKKMSLLMQEMFRNLDAPWLRQMAEKQAANYEQIGGVPVLTRHFTDGKAAHETTLTAMRSEALPATLFDVPAGFTKRDMTSR